MGEGMSVQFIMVCLREMNLLDGLLGMCGGLMELFIPFVVLSNTLLE